MTQSRHDLELYEGFRLYDWNEFHYECWKYSWSSLPWIDQLTRERQEHKRYFLWRWSSHKVSHFTFWSWNKFKFYKSDQIILHSLMKFCKFAKKKFWVKFVEIILNQSVRGLQSLLPWTESTHICLSSLNTGHSGSHWHEHDEDDGVDGDDEEDTGSPRPRHTSSCWQSAMRGVLSIGSVLRVLSDQNQRFSFIHQSLELARLSQHQSNIYIRIVAHHHKIQGEHIIRIQGDTKY